jgi:hypothetical protein
MINQVEIYPIKANEGSGIIDLCKKANIDLVITSTMTNHSFFKPKDVVKSLLDLLPCPVLFICPNYCI